MRILILGGHGFVGKNLVGALRNTEHETLALSRRDGLDLRDYALTKKHLDEIKPHAIFNLAANVGSLHYVTTYAADVVNDNVQMALNIYRAVKEVCPNARIINPVANCSYPGEVNVQIEADWWKGDVHPSVYAYGNSRRMIYVLSYCYKAQYGIKAINFLVPNTFGPGDHTDPNKVHALNGMIIRMIKAQRNGDKEFEIWGTGQPVREWVYVDDVVEIFRRGLTIDEDLTYPVNIAQNKGYSIKESAEMISEAVGFSGKFIFNTSYQDGAAVKIMDDKRFRTLFPDFKFHDHKKAIQETVDYYKKLI
jgi:GDP-L-fucose synthase